MAVVSVVFAIFWRFSIQPTSILSGLDAPGGITNWGACPSITAEDRRWQAYPPGDSLELNRRLSERFPSGSDEKLLWEFLKSQHFTSWPPCKNDFSINVAEFKIRQVEFFSSMYSEVY